VDFAKDFKTSFNELKKHKIIIVPSLLSLIIPSILILSFFYFSGFYNIGIDLIKFTHQYNAEKEKYFAENQNFSDVNYTREYFNYIGQTDDYKKEMINKYLQERGLIDENHIEKAFFSLVNAKNIMLLITFVLIILGVSFYLSCVSFAIITLNIKKRDLNFENVVNMANKFLLSLLSLRILIFFIIGIPIILGIAVLTSSFFINVLLGGLLTFFFIIASIVYIIFVALRLFFATPIMFIEEKSSLDSLKFSYNITKHHLKQVLLVSAIMYGILVFVNSLGGSPLYEGFVSFVVSGDIAKLITRQLTNSIFI